MSDKLKSLKTEWTEREKRLGQTKRSVLFKRFPAWLNNSVHNKHLKFIIQNLPLRPKNILDVGCGYGRLSREIQQIHPTTHFQGIDLCTPFAIAYEKEFGNCYNGAIQEFHSEARYDVIIVVTLLMYIRYEERQKIISRLWDLLASGGVLICIEPAIEFQKLWKSTTHTSNASPTGGEVTYFDMSQLEKCFTSLPGVTISKKKSLHLLPGLVNIHHAISVVKQLADYHDS